MEDISEKVRSYIIANFLFGDGSRLGDNTSFLENSIIDSTGMLEIITFVEQEFGIVINHSELVPDNLDSIKNLNVFIRQKKSATLGIVREAA